MVPTKRQKSNKSITADTLVRDVETILQRYLKTDSHIIVGLSGGVDSVVLLDILSRLAAQMRFKLSALHVNHGISRNAADWSHFCARLCARHGIPITVAYLRVTKTAGESLEALAREKRYHIFSRLRGDSRQCLTFLALAQHRDDQAETVLLQLFRGAGVRGLSAMPQLKKQSIDAAPQILRPLLDTTRNRIEAYAALRHLQWIQDDSNDDVQFKRNFLRHKVFPVLTRIYPGLSGTLSRSSRHMAEASQLLDELAESDARQCMVSGRLVVAALNELSLPRARNLLRYVLWRQGIPVPNTVRLAEILRQLLSSAPDTRLHIPFGNHEIRVYQGCVYIQKASRQPDAGLQWTWRGETELVLDAACGSILFNHVQGQGISSEKLMQAPVIIKTRQGGERFKPDCNRPRRSLKNLLQEASIAPWSRYTLPLLYCGEKLVWVPQIGIDCEFQARSGEHGIDLEWRNP